MTKEDLKDFEPYSNILSVALQAAKKAGIVINNKIDLRAVSSGLELKAAIDHIADDTIINEIKRNSPSHAILTEETGFPKEPSGQLWVVDPLDGTTYYLNGSRMYSTLISYVEHGIPKVSVAYLPRSDEMLSTVSGHGAFLNNNKIEVPNTLRPICRANIVFDPGYDPQGGKMVSELFDKLRSYVGNVSIFNSNGYTLSLMALQEIAGFVHYSSKIWEVAGLHILQESGGTITDFDGKSLRLDFHRSTAFPFVTSRGIDHNELLNVLKR